MINMLNAYIRFIQDFLVIEDIDVEMNEAISKKYLLSNSPARCYPTERKIFINLENCRNEIEMLIVITHELRHQYQYDVCAIDEMAKLEDSQTVVQWKKNFNNYSSLGNETYSCQPLEVDAEVFTFFLMYKLFGIKTNGMKEYPQFIARFEEIQSMYYDDEITDSLIETGFINYMEELQNRIIELNGTITN